MLGQGAEQGACRTFWVPGPEFPGGWQCHPPEESCTGRAWVGCWGVAGAGPVPGLGVGSAGAPTGVWRRDALWPESEPLLDLQCHAPCARLPLEIEGALQALCSPGLGQDICAGPRALPACWVALFPCLPVAQTAHTPLQSQVLSRTCRRTISGTWVTFAALSFTFFIPGSSHRAFA